MAHVENGHTRIAIIGAGLGGISAAIALKDKLNFTQFTIYEQAPGVGGTWRDNTYPGCACDVPSHWYSLSSELNPNWSLEWSTQPEILEYWISLVKKHNLAPHIRFNHKVESSTWDPTVHAYQLSIRDLKSNSQIYTTTRIIISAIGTFTEPKFPAEILGRESFKGDIWHSARWNHKVDLSGKKIGVIGNGCSAIQFIPKIAQDPTTKIWNFCRTTNWFIPFPQTKYSSLVRWLFRHIPLLMRFYRWSIVAKLDITYSLLWPKTSAWFRRIIEKEFATYMRKTAPEKHHERLIPKYPLGCKRLIRDPGYLKCLHQDNVKLNWDGIQSIVEDGIVTKKGEHIQLDIIIFGTGFDIISSPLQIVGSSGQSMKEYWNSINGPEAYLGTAIPGFPNFFMIYGPNTSTGHASAISMEESQINYILRTIKPILSGKVKSLEVKAEASRTYNKQLQKSLRETVWMDCLSWYRAGNSDGKLVATYPGSVTKFWWSTLTPKWKDYEARGSEAWAPSGAFVELVKAILIL